MTEGIEGIPGIPGIPMIPGIAAPINLVRGETISRSRQGEDFSFQQVPRRRCPLRLLHIWRE